MKTVKRVTAKGIELSNQESIRTLEEKENYKNLEISKADTINQKETKDKVRKKKTLHKTTKLLETKPRKRNLIKGINACAVRLVRYCAPFLKKDKKGTQTNEPKNK